MISRKIGPAHKPSSIIVIPLENIAPTGWRSKKHYIPTLFRLIVRSLQVKVGGLGNFLRVKISRLERVSCKSGSYILIFISRSLKSKFTTIILLVVHPMKGIVEATAWYMSYISGTRLKKWCLHRAPLKSAASQQKTHELFSASDYWSSRQMYISCILSCLIVPLCWSAHPCQTQ